jgi:hypothetical protein
MMLQQVTTLFRISQISQLHLLISWTTLLLNKYMALVLTTSRMRRDKVLVALKLWLTAWQLMRSRRCGTAQSRCIFSGSYQTGMTALSLQSRCTE